MKSKERIEFLSAVLLISDNPEKLAKFYTDIIGVPMEEEQHGESEKHYGCELGDLHFAIHPKSNFKNSNLGTGSIKLAFTVFNLNALVERLKQFNIQLDYPPKDTGFALMTAIYDPDGNYIEFTQLSDRWFNHLSKRKDQGIDVVQRWKELKN